MYCIFTLALAPVYSVSKVPLGAFFAVAALSEVLAGLVTHPTVLVAPTVTIALAI